MRISDWSSDVCSSDLNLAVDDQHLDSLQPYIGMTLDYPLNLNTAHPANLQARLGYAYETLDATHDVSVSSTDGTRFVIPGTTDTRRILSAGLGVNVSVAKATNAYLRSDDVFHIRSEERRVGKECVRTFRSRLSTYHYTKKTYIQID